MPSPIIPLQPIDYQIIPDEYLKEYLNSLKEKMIQEEEKSFGEYCRYAFMQIESIARNFTGKHDTQNGYISDVIAECLGIEGIPWKERSDRCEIYKEIEYIHKIRNKVCHGNGFGHDVFTALWYDEKYSIYVQIDRKRQFQMNTKLYDDLVKYLDKNNVNYSEKNFKLDDKSFICSFYINPNDIRTAEKIYCDFLRPSTVKQVNGNLKFYKIKQGFAADYFKKADCKSVEKTVINFLKKVYSPPTLESLS
ncbi:hypothetical protein LQF76_10750 [Gloeomargaritales cyanobacterium VI4D9]|nr:hypothetical protein LQF76_10750 [Gloeomargaritales cyanobacterium VI4D9]